MKMFLSILIASFALNANATLVGTAIPGVHPSQQASVQIIKGKQTCSVESVEAVRDFVMELLGSGGFDRPDYIGINTIGEIDANGGRLIAVDLSHVRGATPDLYVRVTAAKVDGNCIVLSVEKVVTSGISVHN